jgi:sialate O-acetylesterase
MARAAENGKWRVNLKPLAASGEPRALTIAGAKDRVEFQDVLVGEVWLCSGQSNM